MYEPNYNQSSSGSPIQSGVSPFKPEYDEYISENPGRGSLKVQISAAFEAFPVAGVEVDVAVYSDGVRYSLYHDVTDSSGIVDNMILPAKSKDLMLAPERSDADEAHYLISLYHPDFQTVLDKRITVYDRIETILPVTLTPIAKQRSEGM